MSSPRWTWWSGCVFVGVVAMLLAPVVLLFCLMHVGWWWSPEARVPLDGETDRVVLDRPGATYALWGDVSITDPSCALRSSEGDEIRQVFVPPGERALVEMGGIADPTASVLFTAPADGVVRVRCAPIWSRPPALLDIGPALHLAVPVAADVVTVLPGPALFVLGVGTTVVGRLGVRARQTVSVSGQGRLEGWTATLT